MRAPARSERARATDRGGVAAPGNRGAAAAHVRPSPITPTLLTGSSTAKAWPSAVRRHSRVSTQAPRGPYRITHDATVPGLTLTLTCTVTSSGTIPATY
jgi:hypothetical protein